MEILEEDFKKRADIFLLEFLKKNGFDNVSRSFLKDIWNDFLLINDIPVKPSYRLRKGDIFTVKINEIEKAIAEQYSCPNLLGQEGNLNIVYENNNCLIINKPSGVVVHPGFGNKDNTLANYVKGYLQRKNEYDVSLKRGGIVHRLDKGVSGLILFAKNSKAQSYYQAQFESHSVQKVYLAEIEYKNISENFVKYFRKDNLDLRKELEILEKNNFICDDSWYKIEGYIRRSMINRMKMKLEKFSKGNGKYSLTYVKPINENQLLVKIQTGRMHQIRASLEYEGIHIVGDTLYSSNKGKGGIPESIGLKSIFLSLKDVNGSNLTISLLENEKEKKNN